MSTEQIIATILIRDRYRYDRYHYLMRMVVASFALLCLSVLGNVAMFMKDTQYRYLMTAPTGNLVKIIPLDVPNMEDKDVLSWAVDAATRINSYDFANYRRQFRTAQDDMTVVGWENFQKALKESGNFVAVTENKYVTTASPTNSPRLLWKGLIRGADGSYRYGWVVNVPLLVTYRSSKQQTEQSFNLEMTIVRLPVWVNNGTGLGIRQMIARPN